MSRAAHILSSAADIDALLDRTHRIAVLGIKPETRPDRPAFFVPEFVQQAGFEIIPVPVYYPDVTHILGLRVVRRLIDIEGPIDLVDVFRRPEHLAAHVSDIVAARPGAVWFQSGIRNDAVARQLVEAGIDVVQDRCLMVEIENRR